MRVLLVAMPDTIGALDPVIRVPNLGICSIAGNVKGCEIKVIDLAFHNKGITKFLIGLLHDYQPDVIGLSAMSFQYASACHVARICRANAPKARVALGGYHATLMYEEIAKGADRGLFDFLVRGEGEATFSSLVRQLKSERPAFDEIPGLSFSSNRTFQHNEARQLVDLDSLDLPKRSARVIDKASFLGLPFDCAETSRGCTMGCRFCSITHMYGRCIREFTLDRVIADLKTIRHSGKQGVFFVDDNITLNVPRLKRLCQLICDERLNDVSYVMQASVAGIDSDPELPVFLRKAGFKWVFLGIENGITKNLRSMGKPGSIDGIRRAVKSLRDEAIGVFGGFIIANPDDTAEDIRATFRLALELGIDHPIFQYLTPYPKTETREDLMASGLITNQNDFSLYNGFTANVRTNALTPRQLNDAVFLNGLRLYFNPRYLMRSRFWRYDASFWPSLIANNVGYVVGARSGRVFPSKHRW